MRRFSERYARRPSPVLRDAYFERIWRRPLVMILAIFISKKLKLSTKVRFVLHDYVTLDKKLAIDQVGGPQVAKGELAQQEVQLLL